MLQPTTPDIALLPQLRKDKEILFRQLEISEATLKAVIRQNATAFYANGTEHEDTLRSRIAHNLRLLDAVTHYMNHIEENDPATVNDRIGVGMALLNGACRVGEAA